MTTTTATIAHFATCEFATCDCTIPCDCIIACECYHCEGCGEWTTEALSEPLSAKAGRLAYHEVCDDCLYDLNNM
jgi:hypothetical protein